MNIRNSCVGGVNGGEKKEKKNMPDLCHSQMHACSFAYVHNFAIGRQDKHETVQSLKSKGINSRLSVDPRKREKRNDKEEKKEKKGEEYSGSLEVRVQRLVTALISFVLNRTVFSTPGRALISFN